MVPVGPLAQVWRDGARQVVLARFLSDPQLPVIVVCISQLRTLNRTVGTNSGPAVFVGWLTDHE